MTEADLRSSSLRILECTACGEPVWNEPSAALIRLHCGYCGHDDTRELTPMLSPEASESAYRDGQRNTGSRRLETDLSSAPPGISRLPTVLELRTAISEATRALAALAPDDKTRPSLEHRLLYCAAVLASKYVQKHDALRARAVLETALETHRHPVYRALVLARLARLAAFGDAGDLALRWLSQVPEGLRVAEVTCDVRLAKAMIARSKGDAKAMLEELGGEESWGPTSRPLAMALRVDAHERLGDLGTARKVYRRGSRGGALAFGSVINTFGLAPKTRERTVTIGFFALGLVAIAFGGMALALRGHTLAAFVVIIVTLVSAIVLKRF